MLVIAYLYRFSERQVEEATNLNPVVKEFVGLAVDQLAPDHGTLSEFKRRCIKRTAGTHSNPSATMCLDGRGESR